MGKYTINYACGHGSFEKQLYGKRTQRDSYVRWAEANMVCPACWRASKEVEPLNMVVTVTPEPDMQIVITITGGTESRKDDLRALGYVKGEDGWRKLVEVNNIEPVREDTEKLKIACVDCRYDISPENFAKIKNMQPRKS